MIGSSSVVRPASAFSIAERAAGYTEEAIVNRLAALQLEFGAAVGALAETVGAENVHDDVAPFTGSEDFAYMIEDLPGNYVMVGTGPGAMPHNPGYDFNDEILPTAASYFCRLVQAELA